MYNLHQSSLLLQSSYKSNLFIYQISYSLKFLYFPLINYLSNKINIAYIIYHHTSIIQVYLHNEIILYRHFMSFPWVLY